MGGHRAIKELQARGLPVNYVAVDREMPGNLEVPREPMLPTKWAIPPEIKQERVTRSVRTLVTAALSRAKSDSQHAIAAVATDNAVPVQAVLSHVKKDLSGLTERAKTQFNNIATAQASRPRHELAPDERARPPRAGDRQS
jgi:hypothetical protein